MSCRRCLQTERGASLGARFRAYCLATIVLLLGGGILTTIDSPAVSANLPTPWVGVWERLIIAVWMLWLVVLAVKLLRRPQIAAQRSRS